MTLELNRDQCRALKLMDEVLRDLSIKRCLIGALGAQASIGFSNRVTLDIDIAVMVSSWGHYDEMKEALIDRGFSPTDIQHRLRLGTCRVDILPYSAAILTGGRLVWPRGNTMDMTGFEHVFESTETIEVANGVEWTVVSIPAFLLLKLACYRDRGLPKDLADIVSCLDKYDCNPSTSGRYDVCYESSELNWDNAGAYLAGKAVRGLSDPNASELVEILVDAFSDSDVPAMDGVLREIGRSTAEDAERDRIVELVRMFATGFRI